MATKNGHFAKRISHKIRDQILGLLYAKTLDAGCLPVKILCNEGALSSIGLTTCSIMPISGRLINCAIPTIGRAGQPAHAAFPSQSQPKDGRHRAGMPTLRPVRHRQCRGQGLGRRGWRLEDWLGASPVSPVPSQGMARFRRACHAPTERGLNANSLGNASTTTRAPE